MNHFFRQFLGLAGAGVISLAGCGDEPAAPVKAGIGAGGSGEEGGGGTSGAISCATLSRRLQEVLDASVTAQSLPGVAAAVDVDDCTWRGAAGVSDTVAKRPMAPEALFRVGSITKTFIATLALMLRAEDELSLEDPVSKYVDGIPGGDGITLREILNHTSGLHDYTENEDFARAAAADPTRAWTPRQLIDYGAAKPPYFKPGQGFRYSNTNYIIAGLAVEAASGQEMDALLRARILERADLAHTYLEGTQPALPGLVHGYESNGGELVDVTSAMDPSMVGTAGAMVSNTDDLTRFYAHLVRGALLGPAELHEMTRWVDTKIPQLPGYGLGLVEHRTSIGAAHGHPGGILGFLSASYHLVDSDAAVTVLINSGYADLDRLVDDLLNVLRTP